MRVVLLLYSFLPTYLPRLGITDRLFIRSFPSHSESPHVRNWVGVGRCPRRCGDVSKPCHQIPLLDYHVISFCGALLLFLRGDSRDLLGIPF